MRLRRRAESGQTVIEFAIICTVLLILTIGLIDVGRAFFQYNSVVDAARFGARWASVQGGTCDLPGGNTTDWCTQQGLITNGSNLFQQAGSKPIQGNGTVCPSFSSTPNDYYYVNDPDYWPTQSGIPAGSDTTHDNDFNGDTDSDPVTKQTSIVGAIGERFDTSGGSTHTVNGTIAGFDLSQLRVCIQNSNASGTSPQSGGDYVTVIVHYHFTPAGPLLGGGGFDLEATSTYEIEGSP